MTKQSTQNVLSSLSAWIEATRAYSECARGLDHRPLWTSFDALDQSLRGVASQARSFELATRVGEIRENLRRVTERFASDWYSDDDTDAPCDVEWDVHNLVRQVDPSHVVPEEIEPSNVVGHVYPHEFDED